VKFSKPNSWRYAVHYCGWDKECKMYGAPNVLYINFLKRSNGESVLINFSKEKLG
jgi:hypothetical protein